MSSVRWHGTCMPAFVQRHADRLSEKSRFETSFFTRTRSAFRLSVRPGYWTLYRPFSDHANMSAVRQSRIATSTDAVLRTRTRQPGGLLAQHAACVKPILSHLTSDRPQTAFRTCCNSTRCFGRRYLRHLRAYATKRLHVS